MRVPLYGKVHLCRDCDNAVREAKGGGTHILSDGEVAALGEALGMNIGDDGPDVAESRTIENSKWLLFNSLEHFGHDHQIDRCLEEMAELASALLHRRRGEDYDVITEIADVEIMIQKMRILFGANAVDAAISQKLDRVAGLMRAE